MIGHFPPPPKKKDKENDRTLLRTAAFLVFKQPTGVAVALEEAHVAALTAGGTEAAAGD